MRWPMGRVAVEGDSMQPWLLAGDWLLVGWGAPVRPGDVVVARHPVRPGMLVVKRATRRRADGAWVLLGDNLTSSEDSRTFGEVPDALVLGRVLGRYWPPRRRG